MLLELKPFYNNNFTHIYNNVMRLISIHNNNKINLGVRFSPFSQFIQLSSKEAEVVVESRPPVRGWPTVAVDAGEGCEGKHRDRQRDREQGTLGFGGVGPAGVTPGGRRRDAYGGDGGGAWWWWLSV